MKKKIAIAVVLLAVLVSGFIFFNRSKQTQVQFVTVKRQDIKSTVSSSGSLTGKNSADLKFRSAGKLAFINVRTGDQVFEGEVIAGLDAQDLSITLQQAQNTLRDKQATVDKVLDDIHLFQYGNGGFVNVGTSNETMTQRQLRSSAEVARDNAFDSIKAAKRDFGDTVIISPLSGIVTHSVQLPGQTVTGADIIARVVDTTEIFFDAEIDEADIVNISQGQKAEITLDAYPDQIFQGEVDEIQPEIKTTSSGAKVVLVRIKMDTPVKFINGLSGQAAIIISEQAQVLTIPQEALRDDNTVVVSQNNVLRIQKVEPGLRSDTDVEIKSGLNENDKVLLNNSGKTF